MSRVALSSSRLEDERFTFNGEANISLVVDSVRLYYYTKYKNMCVKNN